LTLSLGRKVSHSAELTICLCQQWTGPPKVCF
jgi:hypothetical protein